MRPLLLPNVVEHGIRPLNLEASAVVSTLAYFSVFRHPLTLGELEQYVQYCPLPGDSLASTLESLLSRGLVEATGGFFHLPGQGQLEALRTQRNLRAGPWIGQVGSSAAVLSRLPFVEGVALSGPLAQGTQDVGGDLDFVLIAEEGRVWTTRLFLSFLLKALPRDQRHRFCVDQVLGSGGLAVRRRNLFSATEIAFLLPLFNGGLWEAFFQANGWVKEFYPHWKPRTGEVTESSSLPGKDFLEEALSGRAGEWVERRFRKGFSRRTRPLGPETPGEVAFRLERSRDDIGHARARETATRERFHQELAAYQFRHGVRLAHWHWNLHDALRASALAG
jgi:hypothetical protein